MTPVKAAIGAACLMTGASLAAPAHAQINGGVNGAASSEDAIDAATAMEENLTGTAAAQNSSAIGTATAPSPNFDANTFNNGLSEVGNPGISGANTNAGTTGHTKGTSNTVAALASGNAPNTSASGANAIPVGVIGEPQTSTLMAAGLGLIAYIGRRRRKRTN